MSYANLKAGVALAALLTLSSPAMAQQGSTSGPAAGTPVAPNTAAEKQNPNQETGGVSPGGAVGAGSPGATARSGTQGGPPPGRAAENDRRADRDMERERGFNRGADDNSRCGCPDRDLRPCYDERGDWGRGGGERWRDRDYRDDYGPRERDGYHGS